MAVDGGQRDADLCSQVDGTARVTGDEHRPQFECLAFDCVTGGNLLRGGGCRFGGHAAVLPVFANEPIGV